MEVVQALSGTQLLFPALAVAAVLICAAFVFSFGFRTPAEPAFDKSPLVLDDRKQNNKKRKVKDKKSSPNRAESKAESSKKSPAKEKKDEKTKEPAKPKEKPTEVKIKVEAKKSEEPKRGKKSKSLADQEKPEDFDDGGWEEVPKKEKKKPKAEEKKESPTKKSKKKRDVEEVKKEGGQMDGELAAVEVDVRGAEDADVVNRELREKINELQRVLKEAELRDNGLLPEEPTPPAAEKTVESDNKKPKKDKKKSESSDESEVKSAGKENLPEDDTESQPAVAFDELGDTWAEAKAPKKGKKKARKE